MVVVMKHVVDGSGRATPGGGWEYDYTESREYEGATLADRERNYYDDSDFYAVVWDEASQSVKTVEYATTRFPTCGNYAKVDATPEVLAKARKYLAEQAFQARKAKLVREASEPAKGKKVRVTGGRKVPKGTVGTVFWAGRSLGFRYRGYNRVQDWMYEDRVGLAFAGADGKPQEAFLKADQVEVVNPADYLPSEATLQALRAKVDREAGSADPGLTYAGWVSSPGMVVM